MLGLANYVVNNPEAVACEYIDWKPFVLGIAGMGLWYLFAQGLLTPHPEQPHHHLLKKGALAASIGFGAIGTSISYFSSGEDCPIEEQGYMG